MEDKTEIHLFERARNAVGSIFLHIEAGDNTAKLIVEVSSFNGKSVMNYLRRDAQLLLRRQNKTKRSVLGPFAKDCKEKVSSVHAEREQLLP
jgi:hypothetical protein